MLLASIALELLPNEVGVLLATAAVGSLLCLPTRFASAVAKISSVDDAVKQYSHE
jgi:hypothetical protein